jgi:hypothetical protein
VSESTFEPSISLHKILQRYRNTSVLEWEVKNKQTTDIKITPWAQLKITAVSEKPAASTFSM